MSDSVNCNCLFRCVLGGGDVVTVSLQLYFRCERDSKEVEG